MKLFLYALCLWAHIHTNLGLLYTTINIYGGSLKVVNNVKSTSRDLLGVTFYNGLSTLTNHDKLKMLQNDLGVNTVSFAQTATNVLLPPASKNWCCKNVQGLRKYINSGAACRNFANAYTPSIFNDPYFRSLGITPFIYVRDVCSKNNPSVSHCAAPVTDGQAGVPVNNDGWWTELLSAYVTCSLQVRRDLRYFHLWNEPNAFFSKFGAQYTGDYFAKFFAQVATKIKKDNPQVKLGGVVTWSIASYKNDWEDWWVPLMERTLKSTPRKLDFFDYHAYDHSGGNMHSEWDAGVATSNALNLYAGLKYGHYLKSCLTETNYGLSAAQAKDNKLHWRNRSISNAKQVIGLSHVPDKFDKRLLFDANSNTYKWLGSVDYQAHKVLKYIQGRQMIDFEVQRNKANPSNRQGSFYNENIMAQIVWDSGQKKSYIVIVNDNESKDVRVTLNDLNGKFKFNQPAQMARLSGNNVVFGTYKSSVGGSTMSITMKPKSIAVLNANVPQPQQTIKRQQFRPNLECIMRKEKSEASFSCGISIWKAGSARRARLEMGVFWGAFGYKWTISVQFKGKNLWSMKDYVPVLRYNEFPLPVQPLTTTGWMQVFITTKKNTNTWVPETRLGYVAVSIDYL